MKKKDVVPGLVLRNTVSGLTGFALPAPGSRTKLKRAHPLFIQVIVYGNTRKFASAWLLENVACA